ncbi:hypothetical protein [Streptomyces sp. NPDC057460]|uniref:hypothetical protein n=1 Tax=Streptomyces sp. NPDC057460 TaxID=3346141 RepID=UPI0036AC3DFD
MSCSFVLDDDQPLSLNSCVGRAAAAILAIHITVAVKWRRAAAGDWGAHAAEISRRATHPGGQGPDPHGP